MASGTKTDEVLALGRLLATHLDAQDFSGHWMANHLAALVKDAETEPVTPEQRAAIVKLTLKVWRRRYTFPGGGPLADFAPVLTVLDRLGDDTPFTFARPFRHDVDVDATPLTDPTRTFAALALDLERLVRDAVRTLLWRQVRQAATDKDDWLQHAQKVGDAIEFDVLERLRLRPRRRLEAATAPDSAATTGTAHNASADTAALGENDETSALHVENLRRMAQRLLEAADALIADERKPTAPAS